MLFCTKILAGRHGLSLFVGVDEYDAPANNSTFTDVNTGLDNDIAKKVAEIERLFKDNFFAVLKQACGKFIISKYFLTGVTPAFRSGISPLHETGIVSGRPELHGICGFTESEVKIIVQHYLCVDEQMAEPMVHAMRRMYNGYFFSNFDYNKSDLLYNPHQVLNYLDEHRNHGVSRHDESTPVHSTAILKSISNIGEFSVEDLINLVSDGNVRLDIITEFGFAELLRVGKDKAITFSLLFYLGILTRGPSGYLKIPNDVVKSDVCIVLSPYIQLARKKIIT